MLSGSRKFLQLQRPDKIEFRPFCRINHRFKFVDMDYCDRLYGDAWASIRSSASSVETADSATS